MTHVIALTGFAGVGKDVFAQHLVERHGYTRLAFADKLKDLLLAVNPYIPGHLDRPVRLRTVVDIAGWDRAKRDYPEVRRLLQDTGMGARSVLSPDLWIRPVIRQAKAYKHVVVSDLRLPNELDALRGTLMESVVVLRLTRSEIGPANGHVSEEPLPHDIEVNLDSVGLDDLPYVIDSLMLLISYYQTGQVAKLPPVWGSNALQWQSPVPAHLTKQFIDSLDEARR